MEISGRMTSSLPPVQASLWEQGFYSIPKIVRVYALILVGIAAVAYAFKAYQDWTQLKLENENLQKEKNNLLAQVQELNTTNTTLEGMNATLGVTSTTLEEMSKTLIVTNRIMTNQSTDITNVKINNQQLAIENEKLKQENLELKKLQETSATHIKDSEAIKRDLRNGNHKLQEEIERLKQLLQDAGIDLKEIKELNAESDDDTDSFQSPPDSPRASRKTPETTTTETLSISFGTQFFKSLMSFIHWAAWIKSSYENDPTSAASREISVRCNREAVLKFLLAYETDILPLLTTKEQELLSPHNLLDKGNTEKNLFFHVTKC